jgi:hypothetical protein
LASKGGSIDLWRERGVSDKIKITQKPYFLRKKNHHENNALKYFGMIGCQKLQAK